MKKRFSIRYKLILIFGILIEAAGITEGLLATKIARTAVSEKIEAHLTDKATDVAEIIDGRLTSFIQFLEGIARMPMFRDETLSYREKTAFLKREVAYNDVLRDAAITDMDGNLYSLDGRKIAASDRNWVQAGMQGKSFITEPYFSRTNDQMIITFSVPIYDNNHQIVGVLGAAAQAEWLSDTISDIIVGESGSCYIIGLTGITIADTDIEIVNSQGSSIERAKTDPAYSTIASFEQRAMTEKEPSTGFFYWENEPEIASFAKIKTTGWTVIISAPYNEFMGTVSTLRRSLYTLGVIILVVALTIVYFVARTMVKPVQTAVNALKNIAQGEGDLTVRLPLIGNDEVTVLSVYFNETIAKISASIQAVGANSAAMEEIGNELASNMTETASAVNEISANIEGVKQQTMTQAASVTETAATVEEIIRAIKQLNSNIQTQATSVAQSSSSIEQMVANIASITGTLEKANGAVKSLATATDDGKTTLVTSNTVTQKIAEESGSLMEASSVIQHIASQTNLLAMNAAIEAAHAGEAGKGFAVVADEIRKLAEDSAMQGKNITTTLKTLSGEIETLSASSKTVEEKFNAIFHLAGQVKDMSDTLTHAMREQENGSKEVLAAIKNINMVTTEVQAGSEEMLKGGESVAEEMRKLDDLTRIITDGMNEMAAGAVQINNAVQEVNDITQKNKRSIENLTKEVGKFKV